MKLTILGIGGHIRIPRAGCSCKMCFQARLEANTINIHMPQENIKIVLNGNELFRYYEEMKFCRTSGKSKA